MISILKKDYFTSFTTLLPSNMYLIPTIYPLTTTSLQPQVLRKRNNPAPRIVFLHNYSKGSQSIIQIAKKKHKQTRLMNSKTKRINASELVFADSGYYTAYCISVWLVGWLVGLHRVLLARGRDYSKVTS